MIPEQRAYSYQSLGGPRMAPQTIGAITLLLLMILILLLLRFVISPMYSTQLVTNSTALPELPPHTTTPEPTWAPLLYSSAFTPCQLSAIVPGTDQLLYGIDITKYDFFTNQTTPYSAFSPIFEFTCDKSRSWNNSENPSLTYSIPDQIGKIKNIPGDKLQIKTQFFQKIHEFKRSLLSRFNIRNNNSNTSIPVGVFSQNNLYGKIQEALFRKNQSIFQIFSYTSSMKVTLSKSSKKLSEKFIDSVNSLPKEYAKAPVEYETFLGTFGTHYIESALMGRSAFQESFLNNEYLYREDTDEMKTSTMRMFLERVNPGESDELEETRLPDSFLVNSKTIFTQFGTSDNPWIYSATFRPIEELITNQRIAAQVQRAVHIKRIKAQFSEVKRFVELSEVKFVKLEDETVFDNLEKFLEEGYIEEFEGDLLLVEKKIEEIEVKAKELKERGMLLFYYTQLRSMSDDVLLCKWSLIRACHANQINYDFEEQNTLDDSLRDTFLRYINARALPNPTQIHVLLKKALWHIEYHQRTVVNICESYLAEGEKAECQACLRANVNCWTAKDLACKTATSWKVIQYTPTLEKKKIEGNCKTVMMLPKVKSINSN